VVVVLQQLGNRVVTMLLEALAVVLRLKQITQMAQLIQAVEAVVAVMVRRPQKVLAVLESLFFLTHLR
jgi:hypothetical protein